MSVFEIGFRDGSTVVVRSLHAATAKVEAAFYRHLSGCDDPLGVLVDPKKCRFVCGPEEDWFPESWGKERRDEAKGKAKEAIEFRLVSLQSNETHLHSEIVFTTAQTKSKP